MRWHVRLWCIFAVAIACDQILVLADDSKNKRTRIRHESSTTLLLHAERSLKSRQS